MKRLTYWWSGRPYHKVILRDEDSGRKMETLRFRNDEWSLLLLAMGALGCRNPGEAIQYALVMAARNAQQLAGGEALEEPAPSIDVPTGMYL